MPPGINLDWSEITKDGQRIVAFKQSQGLPDHLELNVCTVGCTEGIADREGDTKAAGRPHLFRDFSK